MEINMLAVLLGTVLSFVLGGLWYSHAVFGRVWNREAGRGQEAFQPHPLRVFGLSFLFCLVAATAFAVWLGTNPPLETSLVQGLLVGICFVAASFGMTYQFADLSLLMWLIDAGYHVARFMLVALVLGLWH